ncbi:MAG: galactose-1-phosphate uridylyltransferase [Candidatus Fibromonas sp.]|jgi:UDPglucose--hexose-1-phosphate uridylyltransferase|nr:galactose-1-phosphate uridylyltransferase [Candidatus Fibromonas sp.]
MVSEYRQNVMNGEWVIVSAERAKRPADYASAAKAREIPPEHSPKCPFCTGNEHECDTPTYEIKDGNSWKLRVVPNKYAAVFRPGHISNTPLSRTRVAGIHLLAQGYGAAEVVIESPKHNTNLAFVEKTDAYEVIKSYKERFNALSEDPNIAMVNIFKNYGASAGASLEHSHSQIIATHVLATHITDDLAYARRAFNTYGSCIFCDLLKKEIESGDRVVATSRHFIALCPFASKDPYEVHIFPLNHSALFGTMNKEEMEDLAGILQVILAKLFVLLKDPDYNYYVKTVPNSDGDVRYYHWHITIIPRLTRHAGFELGTRIYINTTPPELAAEQLRGAKSEL